MPTKSEWHLTSLEIFGEKRYAVCRKDGIYTEYASRYLPKEEAETLLKQLKEDEQ